MIAYEHMAQTIYKDSWRSLVTKLVSKVLGYLQCDSENTYEQETLWKLEGDLEDHYFMKFNDIVRGP